MRSVLPVLAIGVWWVIASVPARAQTGVVTGTVLDETGVPLIGVNVMIKGSVLGAATNMKGRFVIPRVPTGERAIQFSMIGYQRFETMTLVVERDTARLEVVLKEAPVRTEEVTITAGRRSQSFEQIPVSLAVFDARAIEERSIITLDDALRKIPGVNMTESQVNVRGSSGYSRGFGTRVLILLDGFPLLTGDAGEIKLDAIPMFMIDRIEVVKGAGSALYGSSALGGVINIITKDPVQPFVRARLYSGFYDSPQYEEWKWWGSSPRYFNGFDLQHGNVAGDASYLLTAGLRNNQGYRQRDDFIKWNFSAKTKLRFSPLQNLSAQVSFASDDHANWIYWRNLRHALLPPAAADLTERVISKKLFGAVQYRETFGSSVAYTAKGYAYRTWFNTTSDTSDFSMRPFDKTQSTAVIGGVDLQGTFSLSPQLIAVTGIEGSYSTVDALTFGQRTGWSGALYGQMDYELFEELNLSAGVRVDLTKIDTTNSDGEINPRFGVAYRPLPGTVIRGSYGWGFRSPSIAERFTSASGGGLSTKPNPDIRSERSTSYEIGIRQTLPIGASLDIAAFLNDYSNLVEPTIDVSDGRVYFANITRARISGFEAGLQGSLFNRFAEYNLGYTYMYPRDLTVDDMMKYRPRHLLYGTGAVSYLHARLGVDVRYISRVETIDEALLLVVRDADKRVEIWVTDVRLSYNFLASGFPLIATFMAKNLFQYNYVEIPGNLAPIRNFSLTLEAQL